MEAIAERAETTSAIGGAASKALERHYKKIRKLHLRKLFADDPARGERLTASAIGIELDYSKNRITDETIQLLVQLAEIAGGKRHRSRIAQGLGFACSRRQRRVRGARLFGRDLPAASHGPPARQHPLPR